MTKEFLQSKTNKKSKTLLSKIVYSNFSANRAVNVEDDINHLSFLISTLVEHGNLTKEQITGLMLVDLSTYDEKFVSEKDIKHYEKLAVDIDFYTRKHDEFNYVESFRKIR